MSKYNNIKLIPIDSIPKDEIKIAIKEWAEGDNSMEKLLLTCYDKGIKTSGCHAGAGSYIAFSYQEKINKISCLLSCIEKFPGSQILVCIDGGNPFSGPEWFIPDITIGFDTEYDDETDRYLDMLTETLKNDNNEEKIHPLFDLIEFLINKETGLIIRIRHTMNDKYILTIESRQIIDDRYHYYNKLFKKVGLTEINYLNEREYCHDWKKEFETQEDLLIGMRNIADYIINEYSLEPESSEDNIVNFILLARFKKKNLSNEEFDKWLKQKYEEFYKI